MRSSSVSGHLRKQKSLGANASCYDVNVWCGGKLAKMTCLPVKVKSFCRPSTACVLESPE